MVNSQIWYDFQNLFPDFKSNILQYKIKGKSTLDLKGRSGVNYIFEYKNEKHWSLKTQ